VNIRRFLDRDVPWTYHICVAGFIGVMLLLAHTAPDRYYALVQEDRFVEWWTFLFFLAAAILGFARAIPGRRLGDLLVALFCFAAAGEEVSWGQRIIGYTPPNAFLQYNSQQEVNIHNLVEMFGQPKWTLILILSIYGITPFLVRVPMLGRIASSLRFTTPPPSVTYWIVIVIALLVAYPVSFAGEWLEAIAGSLFFVALRPGRWLAPTAIVGALRAAIVGALVASGLERASEKRADLGEAGSARLACATAETTALGDALVRIAPTLLNGLRVHRRLWSLERKGRADSTLLHALAAVQCVTDDPKSMARRRAFGIDPWGTAYWVRTTRVEGKYVLMVYSFGPNRRRDFDKSGREIGDDIVVTRNE
jgi:hypothetical protein